MPEINVLVIERDKIVQNLLKEELELAGYKVWITSDPKEALELTQAVTFSILLTDLKLPGVNGIELARKFKEMRSDASVIAVVPYYSLKLAIEAISQGEIFDYV